MLVDSLTFYITGIWKLFARTLWMTSSGVDLIIILLRNMHVKDFGLKNIQVGLGFFFSHFREPNSASTFNLSLAHLLL